MHISRFDLNLLKTLDAIFTEGSITRAAKTLHITQPALSHSLARLREQVGDPLFVRQGREVVPTPLARRMIVPVRRALRALEITLNELERFDPAGTPRHFNIGVRDVMEAVLLPPLMKHIDEHAPLVDVTAARVPRSELESELAAGSLDLALDVMLPMSDSIRRTRVSGDRLMVIARNGHPEVGKGMSMDTYMRQDHVLVSSRRSGLSIEDAALNAQGLQRQVRLRCQHYFAACRVVSETDLILTMPEQYARLANQHFDNMVLPFPLEKPELDVYLYWHANAENEPANKWLRELLLAEMKT